MKIIKNFNFNLILMTNLKKVIFHPQFNKSQQKLLKKKKSIKFNNNKNKIFLNNNQCLNNN